MFDHVTIRVSDREASERFYDTVLETLGIAKTHSDAHFAEWDDFSLAEAMDDSPVTRRLHVGFIAQSRALADEFWRVGTETGHRDDGAPGLARSTGRTITGRSCSTPTATVPKPCTTTTSRTDQGGIDHLWIRVADLAAATAFYEAVGPLAGFRRKGRGDSPARVQFGSETGSFSVAAEMPTEHVHVAFPASDDATVDAFHHVATQAGYRDNGAPRERAIYHAGYYGAYVLDPDS